MVAVEVRVGQCANRYMRSKATRMSSGLPQLVTARGESGEIALKLPTNISIAEESAHISAALKTYLAQQPVDVSGVPSLEDRLLEDPTAELNWSAFQGDV